MNRAMAALARHKAAAIAIVALLAASLPLALFAISSAAPPDGKGRPAGPPAAIELAPQPQRIACDGNDASTLRVRLTDDAGKPVADGTTVFFDIRYGFADQVETQTSKGDAFSDIRLYPIAASQPDGRPTVTVYAGDLRASINLICDGGGDPGCNPFSPPQHPMSPPCPTPPPDSPPQCGFPFSPPCVTATPTPTCGKVLSPPCATPTPSVSCDDYTPPEAPLYDLYVDASEDAGVVTARLGVLRTGGPPYQSAQWAVCFDPAALDVFSITRAPGAPLECTSKATPGDDLVLAGCLHFGGNELELSGDAWIVTLTCLKEGSSRLGMGARAPQGFSSFVSWAGVDEYPPYATRGTEVTCSQEGPTVPTPTQRPAEATPIFTAVPGGECQIDGWAVTPTQVPAGHPDALFSLALNASEDVGYVTLVSSIKDLGGGAPYRAVQWDVCFNSAQFVIEGITRAAGAPQDCAGVPTALFVLLYCSIGADKLTHFGDTLVVRLRCLASGDSAFRLYGAPGRTFVHKEGNYQPVAIQDAEVTCTGPGATPTPAVGPQSNNRKRL